MNRNYYESHNAAVQNAKDIQAAQDAILILTEAEKMFQHQTNNNLYLLGGICGFLIASIIEIKRKIKKIENELRSEE